MPRSKKELAQLIAKRDGIGIEEAWECVVECANALEDAFISGSIIEAEDILADYLGLEPDYLDIFIY